MHAGLGSGPNSWREICDLMKIRMSFKLTKNEFEFLQRVGIPVTSVFDASNLQRSTYGPRMKASGAVVASGVTPCKAEGHRLRDSRGHCVMCNPACLAHAKRHQVEGYVYVAFSASAGLVKVGYTSNLADRIRQMKLHKMASATDWTICESIFCKNAGRVESQVHRVLAKFRVDVGYGARDGFSREVFQCGPRTAIIAMRKVVRDEAWVG